MKANTSIIDDTFHKPVGDARFRKHESYVHGVVINRLGPEAYVEPGLSNLGISTRLVDPTEASLFRDYASSDIVEVQHLLNTLADTIARQHAVGIFDPDLNNGGGFFNLGNRGKYSPLTRLDFGWAVAIKYSKELIENLILRADYFVEPASHRRFVTQLLIFLSNWGIYNQVGLREILDKLKLSRMSGYQDVLNQITDDQLASLISAVFDNGLSDSVIGTVLKSDAIQVDWDFVADLHPELLMKPPLEEEHILTGTMEIANPIMMIALDNKAMANPRILKLCETYAFMVIAMHKLLGASGGEIRHYSTDLREKLRVEGVAAFGSAIITGVLLATVQDASQLKNIYISKAEFLRLAKTKHSPIRNLDMSALLNLHESFSVFFSQIAAIAQQLVATGRINEFDYPHGLDNVYSVWANLQRFMSPCEV